MSNVLHLKYRPSKLSEVVGHRSVLKSLGDAFGRDVCRAYIFAGPTGIGKTTLARIVAREVGTRRADVVEIDAATHTGIDAMRAVSDALRYMPLGGKCKTVIVDECHALSKQAWGSLLKVIEEPPAHALWILCTTELFKVPDNIKSRCLVYELNPLDDSDMLALLKRVRDADKLQVGPDVLEVIVRRCGGLPRVALTMLAKVCSGEMDKEAAQELLLEFSEEAQIIDLCRLLISGCNQWQKYTDIIKAIKSPEPEAIRRVIHGYFQKVALNSSGDKAALACGILDAFRDPIFDSGTGMGRILTSLASIIKL